MGQAERLSPFNQSLNPCVIVVLRSGSVSMECMHSLMSCTAVFTSTTDSCSHWNACSGVSSAVFHLGHMESCPVPCLPNVFPTLQFLEACFVTHLYFFVAKPSLHSLLLSSSPQLCLLLEFVCFSSMFS